jgi:hypothetical protein
MSVQVQAELIGKKLHRLRIYIDGVYIGEYEKSQLADIDRKTNEIIAAKAQLLVLFQTHGELQVRWDGKNRKKSIRRVDGFEIGEIPKDVWGKPSWIE